ncbi:MAG: pyruvate, phosphate dikinase [bacterium JZ-2024 1]
MKWTVFLGEGRYSTWEEKVAELGSKGAGLDEMMTLGIPVPPGFTIRTEACRYFLQHNTFPQGLEEEIEYQMSRLEKVLGKKFGDKHQPLLISIRSGAPVSMPGMMDTILNLGLTEEIAENLAHSTGNARFIYDAYRRFLQMMGKVVLSVHGSLFESALEKMKEKRKVQQDVQLSAMDLRELAHQFLRIIEQETGKPFPQDPEEHLRMAIKAVFHSWNNERARAYRKLYKVPDSIGTAVNIVSMVFGNLGERSGTGVAFTRDPATGERRLYGEFLPNAQGEDVVAGIRTPFPLSARDLQPGQTMCLETWMPELYEELQNSADKLERHFREMQDIEFTIEEGKLWLLQTRTGKRSPRAKVVIAVDMAREGLISTEEAILRQNPEEFELLLHTSVSPSFKGKEITKGIPASPGVATGMVVLDWREAEHLSEMGHPVILVRNETSAEDIRGMVAAVGILTTRGGKTSHAAVVARGMGKPAVVGAESIRIVFEGGFLDIPPHRIRKYDIITLDGSTGAVFLGDVPKSPPSLFPEMQELLQWADKYRTLKVRMNAETLEDVEKGKAMGAEGIGLARTEHMFFGENRIGLFRELILLALYERRLRDVRDGESIRIRLRASIEKIQQIQREDFRAILEKMEGFPVVVRLLDPPLHEFLPKTDETISTLAKQTGIHSEFIRSAIEALQEVNPMLGHRGIRLIVTFPEIALIQVKALAQATAELLQQGKKVFPSIMLPLVGFQEELTLIREYIQSTIQEVSEQTGVPLNIPIGTMIELPRSCITADQIAPYVDFFSFGTNDLTQTVLGFSRDDAGKFLPDYIERKILPADPFTVLDREGVGKLIEIAVEKGRKVQPHLEIGICGEHGGDPSSIEFFLNIGVDYVSTSPYRVPVAKLAAAIAELKKKKRITEISRRDI